MKKIKIKKSFLCKIGFHKYIKDKIATHIFECIKCGKIKNMNRGLPE